MCCLAASNPCNPKNKLIFSYWQNLKSQYLNGLLYFRVHRYKMSLKNC